MTKNEVQAILDDADINNDGKLDYSEVKNINNSGTLATLKSSRGLGRVANLIQFIN